MIEAPSLDQAAALAMLEQSHGRLRRLEDAGLGVVERILSDCVTDTRVYVCPDCVDVFSIEPDGEVTLWRVTLRDPGDD